MEDGYLGEAIGKQFTPVLNFQHRDVLGVHLPLETGFHNLAIVQSKQRFPRQARKTCLGLMGAGQMMFLKIMIAVDSKPDDLHTLLDALNDKVQPSKDLIVLPGMVADSLEAASPYENVHDKLLIDATSIIETDPRSSAQPLEGSGTELTPEWRRGDEKTLEIASETMDSILQLEFVTDAMKLRPNMIVVTTDIDGSPKARTGQDWPDEVMAEKQRKQILQLKDSILQLDSKNSIRWLFLTDNDLNLHGSGIHRRLLWQLTSRFDVAGALY